MTPVRLHGRATQAIAVRFTPTALKGQLGVLLAKGPKPGLELDGLTAKTVPAKLKAAAVKRLGDAAGGFDLTRFYAVKTLAKGGLLRGLKTTEGRATVLLVVSPADKGRGAVTMIQEVQGKVAGGSTFVVGG